MNVLIIFETIEGQTRKIVEFVEQQLRSAGQSVKFFNTNDRLGSVSFEGVDKVVLAAPVHERRHPKSFEIFVSTSLAELQACQTLLISVSLKAAFPEGLEEAQAYLTEMEKRTGFVANRRILTAGAVRANGYDYYESQIVQSVALEGHNVELINGVREFTDWNSLHDEIVIFLACTE